MRFQIIHGDRQQFDITINRNVAETAKAISMLFPGEQIAVIALGRARMVVQDGVVVKDYPDVEEHFLPHPNHQYWANVKHQWTTLVSGLPDPEEPDYPAGNYIG